jgi:CheY-like chemotaxis protein
MFKKLFRREKVTKVEHEIITDVDMVIEPIYYPSSTHTDGSAQGSPLINKIDESKYSINILIVDDAKINRYVLKRYILRLKKNISITEAENGLEAIQKVMENNFDIIFMDLKMSVLDGIEASKVILKTHKSMPIIAVTGNIESDTVKTVLRIGMKKCLSKPISLSELNNVFALYFPELE